MASSKYRIIVEATIDKAQLQKELNKIAKTRPVKIRAQVKLDPKDIKNQIQLWNNALEKMEARAPTAFATREVQEQVGALKDLISGYAAGEVPIKDVRVGLDNVRTSMVKTSSAMRSVNKDGMGMAEMFTLATKKVLIWFGATAAIYGTLRQIREGVEYIKELNKEMTNIQIVTGQTSEEMVVLAKSFNSLAKEMSVSTIEVAKGSLEWIRQGKTVEETDKLLRATLMAAKLGNMEAAEATEKLTAVLNGFKLEAEDAESVVDRLVNLDNRYATSVDEIASAMQRSSNSAQLVGVTFNDLASYITVVSSVTRKSAESIGESFKTVFARMRDVNLKKELDEEGEAISDVEKVLADYNILLRDSEGNFRNFAKVLDEVGQMWQQLETIDQSKIAKAFAGVRQSENFIVLMENWQGVTEAQEVAANSMGLASERYRIYLDSIEAHANKFKASWEGMWDALVDDEAIKDLYDFGTLLLDLIDTLGLFNIAIVAAASYLATKWIWIIPVVTSYIDAMAISMGIATGAATTLSLALTGGLIGIAIVGAVVAFKKLNVSIIDTYNNFEKLRIQSSANQSELKSLAEEYLTLANKQDRSNKENIRLLDIQTILNTKYGALTEGIDAYSDAIANNTEEIIKNYDWMQKQAEVEAEIFLRNQKRDYEEAKAFLGKQVREAAGVGGGGVAATAKEYAAILSKRIEAGSDILGNNQRILNNLYKQIDAAESMVIEYERLKNIINTINLDEFPTITLDQIGPPLETSEQVAKRVTDKLKELESFVSGPLSNSYDNFIEKQGDLEEKIAELQARIAEASSFPKSLGRDQELFRLNEELEKTNEAYRKNAEEHTKATNIIIFNMMLQRINQMITTEQLKDNAADIAYKIAYDWAVSNGLMQASSVQTAMVINQAFSDIANGTIIDATGVAARLKAMLDS
ncbi:MAG: phage tail tape measure protein, partial [Promethearchaeota archaeon]